MVGATGELVRFGALVGGFVGGFVGDFVGALLGDFVGLIVGDIDGAFVGESEGDAIEKIIKFDSVSKKFNIEKLKQNIASKIKLILMKHVFVWKYIETIEIIIIISKYYTFINAHLSLDEIAKKWKFANKNNNLNQ